MIAAWMLWATGLGIALYAAAMGADRALLLLRRPARGAWALALAMSVIVPVLLASRRQVELRRPSASFVVGGNVPATQPDVVASFPDFALPVAAPVPARRHLDPRVLNRPLVYLWIAASVLLCLRLLVGGMRLARCRRRWERATLDGESVVFSGEDGPAVAGVWRPVIVMPRWLASCSPAERALVLRHEVEHRRSGDPILLATANLLVALVPWNLALWALRRRLRLAVEVDCDTRVLAAGANLRAYGSLLLAVAERSVAPAFAAPALMESPTLLEWRIRMMTASPPTQPILRGVSALALVILVITSACEAPVPSPLTPRPAPSFSVLPTGAAPDFRSVMSSDMPRVGRAVRDYFPHRVAGDSAPRYFVVDPDGYVVDTARGWGPVATLLPAYPQNRVLAVEATTYPAEPGGLLVNVVRLNRTGATFDATPTPPRLPPSEVVDSRHETVSTPAAVPRLVRDPQRLRPILEAALRERQGSALANPFSGYLALRAYLTSDGRVAAIEPRTAPITRVAVETGLPRTLIVWEAGRISSATVLVEVNELAGPSASAEPQDAKPPVHEPPSTIDRDSNAVRVGRVIDVLWRFYPQALHDEWPSTPIWLLLDSAGEHLVSSHRAAVGLPPHDSSIAAGFGIDVSMLGTWSYAEVHQPFLDVRAVVARLRPTQAASEPQRGAQADIPLDRLKRLVENTYPEVSRLGSADSAVWIVYEMFDGHGTYQASRAPLERPVTNATVAQRVGVSADQVVAFSNTSYRVTEEPSSPVVDVVVVRLRPDARQPRLWQTYVAPVVDQESMVQNFGQVRAILIREIPVRFPEVRTAGDLRFHFVLSSDFQILRVDRIAVPAVAGSQWTRMEPGAEWSGGFGFGVGTFGPGSVAVSISVMPRP